MKICLYPFAPKLCWRISSFIQIIRDFASAEKIHLRIFTLMQNFCGSAMYARKYEGCQDA
jgi:hypothetical protein